MDVANDDLRVTHQPTWPDQPETHVTDRTVSFDGEPIGTVRRIGGGTQGWRWHWVSRNWNHTGFANSFEGALADLRNDHHRMAAADPATTGPLLRTEAEARD